MFSNHFYNKSLKQFANRLRKDGTKAEVKLWKELLSGRQLMGFQFNRQRPIQQYIVDFYCKELRLAIETDGISHIETDVIKKDQLKDRDLHKLGILVIRLQDEEVMNDFENVCETLIQIVNQRKDHIKARPQ